MGINKKTCIFPTFSTLCSIFYETSQVCMPFCLKGNNFIVHQLEENVSSFNNVNKVLKLCHEGRKCFI